MLKILLKRKAFFLGILGILLTFFLVAKMGKKNPPSEPLANPSTNPFPQAVAASGIVESIDENIRLAPAVSGLVKSVKVTPGETIKEGQVLIELDSRNIYGQLLVQKANYQKLKDRDQKLKQLKSPEALSAEQRDTIKNDLQIAAAEVKRMELLLDQLQIKSPIDGMVLQVNTRVGEYISTPMNNDYVPPLLIGRSSGFQVRADVDEINARYIKAGAQAKAFVRGMNQQTAIPLTFVRIDPYVIPKKSLTGDNAERVDTRVLQVIFKTDEKTNLYRGQLLDVYIAY